MVVYRPSFSNKKIMYRIQLFLFGKFDQIVYFGILSGVIMMVIFVMQ